MSEMELDAIKSAFGAIEGLWRDISMGAEEIQMSLIASIQENIGEIGSELFRKLFVNKISSNQVHTPSDRNLVLLQAACCMSCRSLKFLMRYRFGMDFH